MNALTASLQSTDLSGLQNYEEIRPLNSPVEAALEAIGKFKKDLDTVQQGHRDNCCYGTPQWLKGSLCTGVTLGVISAAVCSVVIPIVASSKFDGINYPVMNAVADHIRKYIGANKNQPWAQNLIKSLGDVNSPFTNLYAFRTNLTMFCDTKTYAGLQRLMFDFNIDIPGKIGARTSAGLWGFSLLSHVMGLIGTPLLEVWGWRTTPIKISEYRMLMRHIRSLEEFQRTNGAILDQDLDLEGVDEEGDADQAERIRQAITDGKEVLWNETKVSVHNTVYLTGILTLALSFCMLARWATLVSQQLPQNIQYNTWDRFHTQPHGCSSMEPLNMTYHNGLNDQYYPIVGGIENLHDQTVSYPDEDFYRTMWNEALAGVVTGTITPVVTYLPAVARTIWVTIRTGVFGCRRRLQPVNEGDGDIGKGKS